MNKNQKMKAEGILFMASKQKGKIKINYDIGGVTIIYISDNGYIIAMGCGSTELDALKDTIRNARFLY